MATYSSLNPTKALIWRIIHRDNVPWLLDNGLHCGNSQVRAPHWVSIGNQDLIDKRTSHPVSLHPGGVLGDYIPFYFTPFSVMLNNIRTGWGGVKKRENEEIVILVSSLPKLSAAGISFLFTDSHAYYRWANYYSDLADLNKIDWGILQRRDFKRDPEDPAKIERYQAEVLIHQYLPIDLLLGVICYTDSVKQSIDEQIAIRSLSLEVHVRTGWYF